MKLALINASPRGKNSNSTLLLKWLSRDLPADAEKTFVYAVKAEDQDTAIEKIKTCDYYAITFPLYTDAMPGIAKKFFEGMMESKQSFVGKPVLFIIHSGFPEALQSRMAERYVRHFARLMDMYPAECVIIGGSETMRFAPEEAFAKRADALATLGSKFGSGQPLTEQDMLMPGHQEKLSKALMFLFRLAAPLTDIMWNSMMKKNGVFKQRFDRPYQP